MAGKILARSDALLSDDAKAAWEHDQLDADNWLRVPEFHIDPSAVAFKGFAFPIVHPLTFSEPLFHSMRDLVRALRNAARKQFGTLSNLRTAYSGASLALLSEVAGHTTGRKFSAEEIVALRYFHTMRQFDSARSCWFESKAPKAKTRSPADHNDWRAKHALESLDHFANGAAGVVDVLVSKPLSPRDAADIMRKLASKGGKASAARRSAYSEVPQPSELRREVDRLVASGNSRADALTRLASRYGCSVSWLRTLLRRM